MASFSKRIKFLFTPIDPSVLAVFRILFGLCIMAHIFIFSSPESIEKQYIQPEFFFSFPLFDYLHLPVLQDYQFYIAFVLIGLSGLLICLGLFYRFALITFLICFGYVFLLEKIHYNNHYYLMLLMAFLLLWMPAHQSWSLDSLRKPRPPCSRYWHIFLLRMQICIVYFFAGIVKTNPDWLEGNIFRAWVEHGLHLGRITRWPVVGPLFQQDWVIYGMTYGSTIFDLSIGYFLWNKKTRFWAFVLAAVFHIANQIFFGFGIFHIFMLCALVLFLDPDEPFRALEYFQKRRLKKDREEQITGVPGEVQTEQPFKQKCVAAFIFVYLFIQVLVPLRHWFYPGDVNWTKEGHHFSWRLISGIEVMRGELMVSSKKHDVALTQPLPPVEFSPDMILQHVHHYNNILKERGIDDAVIRAHVESALNGRDFALLIDPSVDLTKEKYPYFGHADWILPLPQNDLISLEIVSISDTTVHTTTYVTGGNEIIYADALWWLKFYIVWPAGILCVLFFLLLKSPRGDSFLFRVNQFLEGINRIQCSSMLWIISFVSITLLRDFLENYHSHRYMVIPLDLHYEFSLFWFALYLILVIFLVTVSGQDVKKVSKVVVIGWTITFLPPLIDTLLGVGVNNLEIERMAYVFRYAWANYLSFFSFSDKFGATTGIKLEIAVVSIVTGLSVLAMTRRWLRAVLAMFGVYTICFAFMALPAIVYDVFLYDMKYPDDYSAVFTVMLLGSLAVYAGLLGKNNLINFAQDVRSILSFRSFRIDRPSMRALMHNIRPERLCHYWLLVLVGYALGIPYSQLNGNDFKFGALAAGLASMAFAWMFAVGVNDLYDVQLDKISNVKRPLVSGQISKENYKVYTFIFFILACLFAFGAGYECVEIIIYFMLGYSFIYSAPPFRLKRFLLVPNILIGLCSVLAVFLGTAMVQGTKTFDVIPQNIVYFIFIVFTFASTLKDLKDQQADRCYNVCTLPVLLGDLKARVMIGILIACCFLFLPIIFDQPQMMWPSVIWAVLALVFTIKKTEIWVFFLWFGYAILFLTKILS